MAFLIAQIALWLLLTGLLGLVLGWWLGRSSAGGRLSEAEEEWQERLAVAETDAQALQERREAMSTELSTLRNDLERANQRANKVAVNLSESERLLAEERTSGGRELEERDAEIRALRSEIERWRGERTDLERSHSRTDEDLDRLARELAASHDRIAELESAVARGRHQLAEVERSLTPGGDIIALTEEVQRLRAVKADFQEWMLGEARREEELEHAQQRLDRVTTERDALAAQADELRTRIAGEQARAAELESGGEEAEALRVELGKRDARIADLEAHVVSHAGLEEEVEQLRSRLAATRAVSDDSSHLEQRLREAQLRATRAEAAQGQASRELEALLASRLVDIDGSPAVKPGERAAPELLEAPRGTSDDLKEIRGVGEVLEQTLNRLGIYHYHQIAAWSRSDIEWVTSHIDTFPDRIARDGWVEQAAELHREHHGDDTG